MAAVVSAVAGGAVGCSPGSPDETSTSSATTSATPTGTPTTDPAAAQEQAFVDAATAALTALVATSDEIGQAGYADWAPMAGLVGGDLRVRAQDLHEQRAASGSRQTGSTTIDDVTVAEYDAGPDGGGRERVVLDACVDTSDVDIVLADGTSRLDPDEPTRLVVRYTVQNTDGHWTVDDIASDPAQTC